MTSPMPERARRLAGAALAATPAGLLTDLDGTLAPIDPDPHGVLLAPGAADALGVLARQLAVTGIVTGRAAADARAILGRDDLLVVGNHGLEWLDPGAALPRPNPSLDWVAPVVERWLAAAREAAGDPGVALDAKGRSGTIHYRAARDRRAARHAILAATAGASDEGLEVREGRLSVELRPAGAGDKGAAVREIVATFGLRGLVVAGDDVTDLDMFRAAADLRERHGLAVAILAVGGDDEVPPAVADAADATLASPAELVAALRAVAAEG